MGLVPAAGRALRIAPLPCSKEIFPVGFGPYGPDGGPRPKPVCRYLLEQLARGGADRAVVVIRAEKWDIPSALAAAPVPGLGLAYVALDDSPDPVASLAHGAPFVDDALVLFGFPDIVMAPDDVFVHLRQRQAETGAAAVLGLFEVNTPDRGDLVDVDGEGRVRAVVPLPERPPWPLTWNCAVWTPRLTRFLRGYAAEHAGEGAVVGTMLQAAIDAGLHVEGLVVPGGTYLDIGTPDDLTEALRRYGS